jgi:osmotically-inducible protein OsmY
MQILRAIMLSLAAALFVVYLPGCASSNTGRATGQVVDDASITARVKTALAKEAGVGRSLDVNVTTYRGTVQLSGFVESRDLADRAAEIARGVDGVRSVRNDIQVASQGSGTGASTGAGRSSSDRSGSSSD